LAVLAGLVAGSRDFTGRPEKLAAVPLEPGTHKADAEGVTVAEHVFIVTDGR